MPLMKSALMLRWILPTWLAFLATRMRTLGWSLDFYSLRLFVLTVSLCRRFEEVVSEEEAEVEKSAKRPRESNATEQDAPTSEKHSKKAKKLKAENGAAVPAPTGADGEAPKKGKKDKKAKKGGDAKESPPKTGEDKESESKQKQGDKGSMGELPGGLKIQDAKLGDGPQAKKGARVSMRYVGKLPNGKVFDSNTKGKPVSLRAAACTHSQKTHVIVSFDSSRSGWGLAK